MEINFVISETPLFWKTHHFIKESYLYHLGWIRDFLIQTKGSIIYFVALSFSKQIFSSFNLEAKILLEPILTIRWSHPERNWRRQLMRLHSLPSGLEGWFQAHQFYAQISQDRWKAHLSPNYSCSEPMYFLPSWSHLALRKWMNATFYMRFRVPKNESQLPRNSKSSDKS